MWLLVLICSATQVVLEVQIILLQQLKSKNCTTINVSVETLDMKTEMGCTDFPCLFWEKWIEKEDLKYWQTDFFNLFLHTLSANEEKLCYVW